MRSIMSFPIRRPVKDLHKVLVESQIEAMQRKAIPQGFIKGSLPQALLGFNKKAILCIGIALSAFWNVPAARAVECTEARTFPFTWTLSNSPAYFTSSISIPPNDPEEEENKLFSNNSYTIDYIFNPDPGACLTSPLPAAVSFDLNAILNGVFLVGLPVPEGIGVVIARSSLFPDAPALASGISTSLTTGLGPLTYSKGKGTYGYTVNLHSRVSTNPPRFDLPRGQISVDADFSFAFNLKNPNRNVTYLYPKEDGTHPVPGPLPLLGVGAAFGFSRKLRKRIRSSKYSEVMSAIG